MAASKPKTSSGPTKASVIKYLDNFLVKEKDNKDMSLGNRAAIQRTLQILKGDR